MKKALLLGGFICICCVFLMGTGCAQKTVSVSEAIQNSQALKTVQEKVSYLVKQAEALYNSKQYQQAIDVAKYVLSNLDSKSLEAKALIQKATTQLQAAAQKAVGDVSNKLFGK